MCDTLVKISNIKGLSAFWSDRGVIEVFMDPRLPRKEGLTVTIMKMLRDNGVGNVEWLFTDVAGNHAFFRVKQEKVHIYVVVRKVYEDGKESEVVVGATMVLDEARNMASGHDSEIRAFVPGVPDNWTTVK